MDSDITIQKDYILLEPLSGINYWEILESIGRLMNMEEYREKNDIWVFRDGPVMLLYDDLYKLKDIIEEHHPKNAKRNKTAIVVETGLQFGMADEFAKIAEDLPCEIRVFSDMQSAEDWITE